MVDDLTERLRKIGLEDALPVWVEQVQIQTKTTVDLGFRRQSADFLGEVLRLIENSRREPTQLQEMISELYDDRRGRRFLETPQEEDLLELLNEVESLCVDELLTEEIE